MSAKSPITTHVLDLSAGKPGAGIRVVLEAIDTEGSARHLGEGTTNEDGRIQDLLPPGTLEAGTYRLTFAIEEYYKEREVETFYPSAAITFRVADESQHYHVPLLLSPFGFSTYRGS